MSDEEAPEEARRELSADLIRQAVGDYFGVSAESLLGGHGRQRGRVWARHVAIYLTRELLGWSLPAVGRAYGMDHTSVLYAEQRVMRAMGNGRRDEVESVREICLAYRFVPQLRGGAGWR